MPCGWGGRGFCLFPDHRDNVRALDRIASRTNRRRASQGACKWEWAPGCGYRRKLLGEIGDNTCSKYDVEQKGGQLMTCKANTKRGRPCRAAAGEGGLCFLHANPASARALGQLGGRRNRRVPVLDIEVPETMTYRDLSRLNAQAMNLLLMGKMQPRVAAALSQLSNSQLKVLHGAELEARVATLETQLASEDARTSSKPHEDDASPASGVNDVEQKDEVTGPVSEEGPIDPLGTGSADVAAQPECLDAAPNTGAGEGDEGEAEPEH
jgi:hypothetical protein